MTPSILRITLVVAAIVGIGVVLNIFSSQQRLAAMRDGALRPTAPQPAVRPMAADKVNRETEARRVTLSVRRQLRQRGYLLQTGEADTSIALAAAILAFQFDHNLTLTAEPNDKFLKLMIFAQEQSTGQHRVQPETETARDLIGEVQRALAHLGYGEPHITTQLDTRTREAIRKFERARGLQVSGRISAPLINSLGPAFDATRLKFAAKVAGDGDTTLTASSTNAR